MKTKLETGAGAETGQLGRCDLRATSRGRSQYNQTICAEMAHSYM